MIRELDDTPSPQAQGGEAAEKWGQQYRCGCFLGFPTKRSIPSACPDHARDKQGGAWPLGYPATPQRAPGVDAETLARRFHEAYERLAPSFGYETRQDTRAFDPATPNGRLMIEVCKEIAAPVSAGDGWPAGVLNKAETLAILAQHNAWRRGAKGPQTDPRMLGLALDAVIAALTSGASGVDGGAA